MCECGVVVVVVVVVVVAVYGGGGLVLGEVAATMVKAAIATSRGSLLVAPLMRCFCTNMMDNIVIDDVAEGVGERFFIGSTDHNGRGAWVNHDLIFGDEEYDAYLMEAAEAIWDATDAMPVNSLATQSFRALRVVWDTALVV